VFYLPQDKSFAFPYAIAALIASLVEVCHPNYLSNLSFYPTSENTSKLARGRI